MLIQKTTLSEISNEKSLRYDVDFIKYRKEHEDNYFLFDELFSIVPPSGFQEEELPGDFEYCEIGDSDKNGDVLPVKLNFDLRSLEEENYYKKIENGDITKVDVDEILISKVRPNLKKYIRITDDKKNIYYTTAFVRLKAKEMPDLFYYCFRTVFYNDLMAITRQGKGYPTLNEKDMKTLRFDSIKINKLRSEYNRFHLMIQDVEKRISIMQSNIVPTKKIIDDVFQQKFGFDYETFETLKKNKHYTIKNSSFSNNRDLRFSAKFHRPAGEFVMKQLTNIPNKKMKKFLAEPPLLGASISPSDFDENGSAYYVSMATIKTLEIELEDNQLVSDQYYLEKKNKSVGKYDIILARSGVAIGKVAIINDDFEGIFCDFTMRIRFDREKYNPQFAYFYFRTSFFQYLIEIYKKGLQNQNIFPIVVQEFPLPDISLIEQQKVVDEIETEIKKQEKIKLEIIKLRDKIEKAILKTLPEQDQK